MGSVTRIKTEEARKYIGLIIRKNRLKKGVSQGKLADMVGVTITYICLLESNKSNNRYRRYPSMETLELIAKQFDKTGNDLIMEAVSLGREPKFKLIAFVDKVIETEDQDMIVKINNFVELLLLEKLEAAKGT